MTDREVRRLGRRALLELLLVQTRRCTELEEALARMQDRLVEAEERSRRQQEWLDSRERQLHALRKTLDACRSCPSGEADRTVAPE